MAAMTKNLSRRPHPEVSETGSTGLRLLSDSQPWDGRIDRFASDADDLDPVIDAKFLTDRGLSQIGLPVHEARGRFSGLHGHEHDRSRIVAGAVSKVGRDCRRTD